MKGTPSLRAGALLGFAGGLLAVLQPQRPVVGLIAGGCMLAGALLVGITAWQQHASA